MSLTVKEKELVNIGASVATGCKPWIDYHYKKVVEAGASDNEIKKAISDALLVRDNAKDIKESDGLFISCTNWRTFEIIKYLERDLGKPVITSNQAALWYSLRKIGIRDNITELGKLFEF